MYWLKIYLKKMKIRQQILYAMMIIAILSSFILGIVAFNISKYIIERNYKEAYTYNLEVSSNIVDIQLDNIIDSVRNALLDQRIIGVVKSAPYNYEGRLFSSVDDLELSRALVELAGLHTEIEGISVISTDGKAKFYYKRIRSGDFQKYYREINVLEEEWVKETDLLEGKEKFYSYDVLLGEDKPYFCMTKKLIEPFTGDFVGYMVISLRHNIFEKAFGDGIERYVSVSSMVVNPLGDQVIVFNNGNDARKKAIAEAFLKESRAESTYLFSSSDNRITGWKLINVIDKEDLEKDSMYAGAMILSVLALLILMSIFIASKIANHINRPLNQLETVIEKVGDGNRDIQEEFDESEIGILGNKFKSMVNNNLELRERLLNAQIHERESELLLLQAQINPHFLYNTLDSLYCMAMIEDNEKIAAMVESLSNIFKLSLNKGKTMIKVADEIRHIKEYMAIQNYRFNGRFDLQIDIDEKLYTGYMIKLILQPFVENAIQHGLEKKLGSGYVRIEGHLADGHTMRFRIIDNGVGIGHLEDIQHGYGIQNVKERIRLCYGEEYGIKIKTEVGVGTEVDVVIPFQNKQYEEVENDSTSRI